MLPERERSDHEFLTTLQRIQPATIQDLCASVGVTATAIRQRLLRFQSEGLVARELSRQDRGRPCYVYQVTDAAQKWLGDDHAEVAAVLWREIMRIPQADVRQEILENVRQALVERFGSRIEESSLAGRLQKLCSVLTEHGFDIDLATGEETESGNLPILREHNCPYHEIASEDASFCDLERSVFSEMLGVPVSLASCRVDGHSCCEFQVGAPG